MTVDRLLRQCSGVALLTVALAIGGASAARAQAPADDKPTFDIYGFAMLDMGYDFKQNDPDWFDTARPSRLPKFANQFGQDGHFYVSARQSRSSGSVTAILASSPPWLWPMTTIWRSAGSFPSGSQAWTMLVSASRKFSAE